MLCPGERDAFAREGCVRCSLAVLAIILGILRVEPLTAQVDYRPLRERLDDITDGTQARLSPDGTMAALVRWDAGGSELVVHDFATRNRSVVQPHGERRLQSCAWKSNAQLLCVMTRDRGGAVLLSAELGSSTVREVGKLQRLLHVLPDHPTHVIVEREGKLGPLELRTGKFRSILGRVTLQEANEYRPPVTAQRSRARDWQVSRAGYGARADGVIDGTGVLRVRPELLGLARAGDVERFVGRVAPLRIQRQ